MKTLLKDPLQHRGFYLRIGFVIALVLVIVAFQWTTTYQIPKPRYNQMSPYEEMMKPVRTSQPAATMPDHNRVEKVAKPTDRSNRIRVVPDNTPPAGDRTPDFSSRNPDKMPLLPPPPDVEGPTPPYITISEMPAFPGGIKAALQFIAERIKYPKYEKEIGLEGTTTVGFVIDRTGKVTDIQIVSSPSSGFSKEAKRVLQLMPDWKPGRHNSRFVPVYYELPIRFRIP